MALVSSLVMIPCFSDNNFDKGEAVVEARSQVSRPCMVILGASYAGGWHVDHMDGCNIVNKGIDGNQSFEMSERFERDVLAYNPEYVLLWGFINDIFRSESAQLDTSLERIKSSFKDMVDTARLHNIEPILGTEVTIRERSGIDNWLTGMVGKIMGKQSYQDYINMHVRETNDWLREFARNNNLKILDFEKLLSDAEGKRQAQYSKSDGSHISPLGYDKLTEYSAMELAAYFAANKASLR